MDLRALADRLKIIEVCTRLHWCVDHRDWDGLDGLLAEQVSFPTPAEMAAPDFDPARYRRSRAEVKAAYPGLLAGLITQHLIAGHQVELDGDRAVCRAHAINVHVPETDRGESEKAGELVLHGNEYRFELVRTPAGWRIDGRQTWIRWRWGDEARYDVDQRLLEWSGRVRPAHLWSTSTLTLIKEKLRIRREPQMSPASPALLERVLDADSHEMAPAHFWGPIFGPASGAIADGILESLKMQRGNDFYAPTLTADAAEITDESVWYTKGTSAPGAFDFERRLSVMDQMGVSRQLVFPSYAIFASMLMVGNEATVRDFLGLTGTAQEIHELGKAGLAEYNAWAAATTSRNPDRLRCVAYIMGDGTVEDLIGQTEALIGRGIRAVNIPHGVPPAGISPAAPPMDEFWALLERHNVPLVLHVGNEQGLFASNAWKRAPAFKLGKVQSHELGLEPYSFATLHYTAAHFLTVLVLGGVFERFPSLRVGLIEQGSSWLGPAAENLDMWARDVYAARLRPFISMLPSEYINRNVRVTPFNEFEPVRRDFERYSHLSDCYCYSTDYPHVEGGKDSKQRMYAHVAPLGETVTEKFFAANARLLLPD